MQTNKAEGSSRVRRRRGELSRERVVRAALDLVEEQGIGALSIRGVASRLQSAPMALYTYVTDRQDLEVEMLETMTANLPVDVDETDLLARIAARFTGAHDQLAQHTWVLHVLIRGDLVPKNMFRFADACLGDFIAAGLAPDVALLAHGACWHLMLGEILDRHPAPPAVTPTQRERALRAMPIDQLPSYAHVLENLDPADGPPPCHFRQEINALLEGLLPSSQP